MPRRALRAQPRVSSGAEPPTCGRACSSTTVKVQAVDLPRNLAALAATVLMTIVYLGCYKAAAAMLRFFAELESSGNAAELERQRIAGDGLLIRQVLNQLGKLISSRARLRFTADLDGMGQFRKP